MVNPISIAHLVEEYDAVNVKMVKSVNQKTPGRDTPDKMQEQKFESLERSTEIKRIPPTEMKKSTEMKRGRSRSPIFQKRSDSL